MRAMTDRAAEHAVIAAMLTVLRSEPGNCLTPNAWMQRCYQHYQVSYGDFVFMSPLLVKSGVVRTVRDGWQHIVKYRMTAEMAHIDVEEPQSLQRNKPFRGFFCDE
jgi:hypothetical protein